jgi:carboxypeptidase C (cathepsin A)
MEKLIVAALTALLALAPPGLEAQGPPRGQGPEPSPAAENDTVPEFWRSHHSVRVGGQPIEYDAEVGSIILRDAEQTPTGKLYYTAYTRTDVEDPTRRPVTFSYNGGPGSSSFWLHMGVMGPRRVSVPGVEHADPAPYAIVANEATLLDKTDIVMVDPIGTGFSHPLGDTPGRDFWGIDEDARAIAQFIQRYLSAHNRWNAPKYILGESYGTTRSAVLAGTLQGENIDLNGVILVSAVLDFRTIAFGPAEDVAYITNLPSYAAVAWYHDALPGARPPELQPFLREVEAFALGDYASALLAGAALEASTRGDVLDRMHRYTGLDRAYLDRADLRVTAPEFEKELMRGAGRVVGRLDARYQGPSGDLLAQFPSQDPQSSAISAPYTAAWNTYLRGELGYDGTREYVPSGNVQPWNWNRRSGGGFFGSGAPNVAVDLARALERNPKLEVLLVTGIYDLATPYFAAAWTMDHLGVPPELRDNVTRVDFEAGHMMYVLEDVLPRWRESIGAFIDRTSGGA